MAECGDCENGECPEVILSSDILFDGGFVNVTFDPDATLNDVLLQMESYFNNLVINVSEPVFVLGENCLGMAPGTYSFQEIIQGVIVKLCEVAEGVDVIVTTNDVLLDDIVLPSCLEGFTGTTTTELFNYIMGKICSISDLIPPTPIVDPIPGSGGVHGWTTDKDFPARFINTFAFEKIHKALAENQSYVFEHTTPTYDGANLNIRVLAISAIIENYLVVRTDAESFGLDASKDNYVFLLQTGILDKIAVTIGDPEPSLPVGKTGVILYKATTDIDGVTSLTPMFPQSAFNDPTLTIAPNTIETAMIQDDAVTSAKLADVVTAATKGHVSILSITYNAKGQITSATSNIDMSGVADGDVLVYDNGTGGFIVGQRRAVVTTNYLPVSDGSDYVTSSIKENTGGIEIAKKVEINDGAIENDLNAALNVASTTKYFKPPRMTAAQSSAITKSDGAMLYVTTTDVTFTSIGFWGCENNVWVKL